MSTGSEPARRPGAELLHRGSEHEQVVFCQDRASGLRAIIAIHSTALGPALGGTRFRDYPDEESALQDVLRLSRGMSYKNALAGLDLGGGKAVILGDPAKDASEALLRAFGRFVESLSGRYITACDVGTTSADMDVVARETRHVTGRSAEHGGAGDSGVLTALGVLQGILASAESAWGSDDLTGRRIGVEGAGKVGRRLVRHLVEHGATVVVHDVDPRAAARARGLVRGGGVELAPDREAFLGADLDVYAPCALGGTLTAELAATLSAEIVCGGANNQLAEPGVERILADRGILYAPDYLVNAGGVIQVADELAGYDSARARARALGIRDTARVVYRTAAEQGITPGAAADLLAERRMASIGALHRIHLAG
ncbi:Glu/Leu/Phe/Val dehydrogenase dimerization domain-containing protein [Streptacidiphilus sp. N1-10]|uniref:Valine dehydrogenase n=1 Tax=Streptacidiphilus jeojiensis TaxID=3229225 RepID=A0ABV6XHB5_9ACTN